MHVEFDNGDWRRATAQHWTAIMMGWRLKVDEMKFFPITARSKDILVS